MSRIQHTREAVLASLLVVVALGAVGCRPTSAPAETSVVRGYGKVAAGTSVFARVPAVANLDPELLRALRAAATEAARDGVDLGVNSGWRSARYQQHLFDDAAERFGSDEEAERWVARPGTSVHEAGDAVDVGPSSAAAWLAEHGAAFGLCRIYRNEPWHYELRADAVTEECPPPYADPTEDPRMQQ
ncbi:M15 family metallopeptidase [Mumia zhuanghuii]|uniref:Peptidase M15 n=1 Tax=Mumia zhuanghuii TaxID=2585211 RepID=A0A5C4MYW6_9ACTN|nr:M15 family metallopeptidase [Mumia zhuanghuii]TNC51395.1 peptidase M15 [Mumia zhuanghuii]